MSGLCNVCADPDAETFEAGGLLWCRGCAEAITDEHVEASARERCPTCRGSGWLPAGTARCPDCAP